MTPMKTTFGRLMRLASWLLVFGLLCSLAVDHSGFRGVLQAAAVIDDSWTEDVAAALRQAQRERKDVLMLFTGSDWCPPCIRLEKEILSQSEFLNEITRDFVLVKLDFPRNSPQAESITEQNQEWSRQFGVNAFPTLFLLDYQAKPFAIAGFSDDSVANYVKMLQTSREIRIQRDDKLKQAAAAEGLDRARFLDQALSLMRQELANLYYPELVAEIVELDRKDELGLRTKWNSAAEAELRKAILTDVMIISRLEEPASAIAFIDEVLEEIEFPIADHLSILNIKLNLLREMQDLDGAFELLEQMIGLPGVTVDSQQRLMVKQAFVKAGLAKADDGLKGGLDDGLKLLEQRLAQFPGSVHLLKARGELLDAGGKFEQALAAYEAAITQAKALPDLLIELISAKADTLFELGQEADALTTLDNFIEDARQPADLRAQALLHKSLMMRDRNRVRQARLAENRAVEIVPSSQQQREIQNLVERLRGKFDD